MSQKWRDSILFFAGLAGVAYEAIARNGDRPYLLVVYVGMMGLPPFLWRDEGRLPSILDRLSASKNGGKEREK